MTILTQGEQSPNTMVLNFGKSGTGKSTAMGYTFANGLYIAQRGGLFPIKNVCGYEPATVDLPNIQEVTKLIHQLKGNTDFDAIVIDEFSDLAQKTRSEVERKYSGWKVFTKLNEIVLEFRDAARYSGVHIAINCWEADPKTNKNTGTFVRGGADLTGKLPESLPALCDLVVRSTKNKGTSIQPQNGRPRWEGIFQCKLDTHYTMKDRFGICYNLDVIPQNVGEILRAADIPISRLKGLEWQEDIVDQASSSLCELTNHDDYINQIQTLFSGLISQGVNPKFARWTIRDVEHRTIIKRSINNQSVKYFA